MKEGVISIINGLKSSCKSSKTINLSYCNLNETQCKSVADLFKRCSNLNTVDLSRNRNMKEGVISIFNGLKSSSKSLKIIYLGGCYLNETQCESVADFFNRCSNLNDRIQIIY